MKEIRLDFAMEGVSVIAEIGANLTPGIQFTNDSVSLEKADSTQKSQLLDSLASLDI
jgi:hypothetical protein